MNGEDVRAERMPDLRTTLYWAAQKDIPGGKGDSVEFYTSDISGEYMVVVRGISAEGIIVKGIGEFSVE